MSEKIQLLLDFGQKSAKTTRIWHFGRKWPIWAKFDRKWPIWTILDDFGEFGGNLDDFGQFWLKLANFGKRAGRAVTRN